MKLLQPAATTPETIVDYGLQTNFHVPKSFQEVRLQSFKKIFTKVEYKEQGKQDFVVPLSDVTFAGLNILDIKTHGRLFLSELAFAQLCAMLRVPFDYMQRCPLELRNHNIAYWMDQNEERKVLLRTRWLPSDDPNRTEAAGILRAVLPKTYEPIDNVRILEWIAAALNHFNGALGIHYAKIQEESTHIRLLYEDPIELGAGSISDTHYFGLHISDSEVGERSFISDFADYRVGSESSCLHKVDGKHLVNQRHIHIDFKSLRREFDESFIEASEYRETITDLLKTAQQASVRDPMSFIRKLVRHYRLTNEFAEAVIVAYESEPVATRYGIAQAFSRAAKRMPIDGQIDTEQFVGHYLLEAA